MEAVCTLLQPKVLKNVMRLALDEMERIKELDLKVSFTDKLEEILKNICVIY